MKKINYIFIAAVTLMMFSCTDYEGSKLKELTESNSTLVKSTAQMKNVSLSGSITSFVDCYLILTDFTGNETKIALTADALNTEVFESTSASGVFSADFTIERNSTPLSGKSCIMAFKPGSLNCTCDVKRQAQNDTTYSYSYTFTEYSGSISKTTTLTEDDIAELIDDFNAVKNKATFNYFANEKGWPVAYIKSDDPKE